jgi:cytochrome P450
MIPALLLFAWSHLFALLGGGFVVYVAVDYFRYRHVATLLPYYPVVGQTLAALRLNAFATFPEFVAARAKALDWPATITMKMNFIDGPRYIVLTPQDLEHVQKTNYANYLAGGAMRGKTNEDWFGRGIVNTDGAHWMIQRRIIAREFAPDRFRYYITEVFTTAASRLVDTVAKTIDNAADKSCVEFNATYWFPRLALDAFAAIAMTADIDSLAGKDSCAFGAALDVANEQLVSRFRQLRTIWPLLKWLNVGSEARHTAAIKVIDDLAYSLIDDVIARQVKGNDVAAIPSATGGDDLLTRFLPSATDERTGIVDRKLLRDMCVNMLVAGRDTTSIALQWLFYELTQHPDVEKELMEEIESAVGPHAPNYDNCAELQYLNAVIYETLRLRPPVPFSGRVIAKDDVLPSGLKVKAGEGICFSSYAMGRRPDLWGEDADVFRPSRWMDDNGTCVKESHFKHTAFSGGRRVCVGQDMAVFETKVVVVALLQRFRVTLKPGCDVRAKTSTTLMMVNDLMLYVQPR